ncbi:putative aspartic peptidase domain superfamily [Septoria linicola]|nr:putative aspartic peptidase domain superfamily [Septoria linicola]
MAFPNQRFRPPITQASSFFTTVLAISSDYDFYKITQALLDTGASFNSVSRRVVTTLNLHPVKLERPVEASAAGGHRLTRTESVSLSMTMAGITQFVTCYVDDRDDHLNILIGMPGLAQFRMRLDVAAGPSGETLATVGQDKGDARRWDILRAARATKAEIENAFVGAQRGDDEERFVIHADWLRLAGVELRIIKLSEREAREYMQAGETLEQWRERKRREAEEYAKMLTSSLLEGYEVDGRRKRRRLL